MRCRKPRIKHFEEHGLVVADGSCEREVDFGTIVTVERLRSRRGLRLHLRVGEPLDVAIRRRELWSVEDQLIANGVRVVDWLGAILTHTLADFEAELSRNPVSLRQSSDDA